MDGMPHYCTGCGEVHGGSSGKNPEIEIAKIHAARDVEVAKLHRNEFKPTDGELETQITVAEIEGESRVGAAEAIGEAITPPDPVTVEPAPEDETGPVLDEDETAEPEPPEVTSSPEPRAPKKKSWWGNYS